MTAQRILVYLLRRDLRLCDNPVFYEIHKLSKQASPPFTHVLPIYVIPAQQVETSGFLADPESISPFPEARSEVGKFWRCGPHRAVFLAESVWSLKQDLERVGSGLLIRVGQLGQIAQDVFDQFRTQASDAIVSAVWMTSEEGVEEKREEREVRKAAQKAGVDFRLWLDEKYFIDDRDVPLKKPSDLPDVFTAYRKSAEPLREAPRKPVSTPPSLPALPSFLPSQPAPFAIPESFEGMKSALLKPLNNQPLLADPPAFPPGVKSAHPFRGGSQEGLHRIQHLLKQGVMTRYKDTRNGLLGTDFSTKLSAWLALGCITARQVHARLVDFEEGYDDQYQGTEGYGKGENAGTAAVRFELLWRDYMRLCTRKFGPRLFKVQGFRNDTSYSWKTPDQDSKVAAMFQRFLRGTTGTGLIDASQRELYLTGYTSNRARQNVASYLAKHLGIDWRLGAEWYEANLADYDVSNNWGNWQYVAGVGNDPRGEARVFNPVKQAFDYDPQGEYCKAWVEELRALHDPQEIFQVWKVPQSRRAALGLLGNEMVEYPLVKIDFRVGARGSGRRGGGGGGGGGRYGGSSRGSSKPEGRSGREHNDDGSRGRGSGSEGMGSGSSSRGGHRGRGMGKNDATRSTWVRGSSREVVIGRPRQCLPVVDDKGHKALKDENSEEIKESHN
ncbi:Cryptochrome DASH [Exophiala dermatitidis]